MSKPSDPRPGKARPGMRRIAALAGLGLLALAGLLIQATPGQAARIESGGDDRVAPAADARGSIGYRLRCWQYGRLLFDEGPVTFGAEARTGADLVAIDRNGAPLIVTQSGATTCLARPYGPARSLALPR